LPHGDVFSNMFVNSQGGAQFPTGGNSANVR